MIRLIIGIFCMAVLVAGCAKNDGTTKNATPEKKSAGQQTIEDLTGKTAVDTGQRAKEKINAISAQQKAENDEVLSGQ